MAVNLQCGFFNAVMQNGTPDRTYTADQVNEYLKGLVSEDGIFETVSSACQVTSGSGMNIVVKEGRGKIGDHWFVIDEDITLTLEASDVILNRIDSVIVKLDYQNRIINAYIKKGALATEPVAPTITRNDDTREICLANIRVNKNISAITQAMITDTRSNNNVCGWIVGLINQMDTTTLFDQYEDAQNTFINEQTTEFNNYFTEQKTDFETWLNTIKSQLGDVCIYRQYVKSYATVKQNEQTFVIPDELHYVHGGLDVLNVYVNGMRLTENEFSIIESTNSVTLAQPLDVVGTIVQLVNHKSVEGSVAESTVLRVEALENTVNNEYSCCYEATGDGDNVTLSNMVKNFLGATGDYAGIADNAQMYVQVCGTVGFSLTLDDHLFDFNSSTTSRRRVIVDFARATLQVVNLNDTTIAVMSCTDNVKVIHANIKAIKKTGQTMYVLYGGTYDDCHVYVDCNNTTGTLYGAYACGDVSNSEIEVVNASANATTCGIYSCTKVVTNTIKMNRGTSIKANGKQLLLGNFVNTNVSVDSSVTQIGTVSL